MSINKISVNNDEIKKYQELNLNLDDENLKNSFNINKSNNNSNNFLKTSNKNNSTEITLNKNNLNLNNLENDNE
jgi:hypothetical protein